MARERLREHRSTSVERAVVRASKGSTYRELSKQFEISPAQLKATKQLAMAIMEVDKKLLAANAKRSAVKQLTPLVESMIHRAVEVIGDRDEAMRWLGTPIRALDYATPISLLGTKK
jgi:Protein of unknown function (DUF2384)